MVGCLCLLVIVTSVQVKGCEPKARISQLAIECFSEAKKAVIKPSLTTSVCLRQILAPHLKGKPIFNQQSMTVKEYNDDQTDGIKMGKKGKKPLSSLSRTCQP